MNAKYSLAALAAGLLALFAYLSFGEGGAATEALSPGVLAAESNEALSEELVPLREVVSTDPEPSRSEAATSATPLPKKAEIQEPPTTDSTNPVRVIVRAMTPFGDPIPGVGIRQVPMLGTLASLTGKGASKEATRSLGITDANGTLIADVVRSGSRLEVEGESFGTLVPGVVHRNAGQEIETVVVAGPLRALRGVIQEEDGTPIPGAIATLICGEDFSAQFGVAVAMASSHIEVQTADEDGRFEFLRSVESPRSMVKGEASGFGYELSPAPDRGDAELTVTLTPSSLGDSVLRGRVVCADGSSSAGARVACEGAFFSAQVEDESGRFELPLEGDETRVLALLPGLQPASYGRAPGEPWPDDLVLTVGAKTLKISGIVVSPANQPLQGLRVGITDGASFGVISEPGENFSTMRRIEDLGSPTGTAGDITDEEGRFALEGLTPRTYRLLAQEPFTLRSVASEPIQAGQSGVRLILDRNAPGGPIAGRVTDSQGSPVAGLSVSTQRDFGIEGHFNAFANAVPSPTTRTDQEGHFEIKYSAFEDADILSHGGVEFASFRIPLEDFEDPMKVEIVLERNSPFIVEWSAGEPPEGAVMMRLETLDGVTEMLGRSSERGVAKMNEVFLGGAKTPAHFVREGNYEVVLLSEDDEIERFPIVLQGGLLQTISH